MRSTAQPTVSRMPTHHAERPCGHQLFRSPTIASDHCPLLVCPALLPSYHRMFARSLPRPLSPTRRHITRNVVNDVPEWLHVWTSSIHDELIDFNWSDQTYEINKGTRCVERNNTFIKPGDAFPPEAQAIMAASGPAWWTGSRV